MQRKEIKITADEIRAKLDYDPESGLFKNKKTGKIYNPNMTNGYVMIMVGKEHFLAHHLAAVLLWGELPNGMIVDHIDGNPARNTADNIRVCSCAQNLWNQKPKKGKVVKYKGVSWHKQSGKFSATCKGKYLGLFADPIEAAEVYDKRARDIFGSFALTNQMLGLLPAREEAA